MQYLTIYFEINNRDERRRVTQERAIEVFGERAVIMLHQIDSEHLKQLYMRGMISHDYSRSDMDKRLRAVHWRIR